MRPALARSLPSCVAIEIRAKTMWPQSLAFIQANSEGDLRGAADPCSRPKVYNLTSGFRIFLSLVQRSKRLRKSVSANGLRFMRRAGCRRSDANCELVVASSENVLSSALRGSIHSNHQSPFKPSNDQFGPSGSTALFGWLQGRTLTCKTAVSRKLQVLRRREKRGPQRSPIFAPKAKAAGHYGLRLNSSGS